MRHHLLRYTLLSLLLTCLLPTMAQEWKQMADRAPLQRALKQLGAETHSLKSHFIQEKKLKLFSRPITSEGTFYFKKPNRVRLSYETPQVYDLIIDGTYLHTVTKRDKNSVPLKSNRMMAQVGELIQASMMGQLALLEQDFVLDFFEAPQAYRVEVTPKHETLRQYISSMTIIFEKKRMVVTELTIVEGSGDETIYRFTQQQLNTIQDEAPFQVK